MAMLRPATRLASPLLLMVLAWTGCRALCHGSVGKPKQRLVVLGAPHHGEHGKKLAPVGAEDLCSASTLRRRLNALRSASDWEGAHVLLWRALHNEPAITEPIHCNIVLAALSESSQWQLALVLLEHMATVGIKRDAYSFSAAICACARANQPERAVETFKAMCASDVPPSSVAFNVAIAAAQRAPNKVQAAELVLAIYTLETLKLRPDAWASAAAISALSDLGEHGRARALFRSLLMPEQVSSHTLAAVLRTAARQRDWTGSIALYEEARAKGVEPTPHTLNAVLGACAADKALGWRRALQLVAEAPSRVADTHCFTTAIRACASSGRWYEATRLLREMERRRVPISAHTYCAAIGAHRKESRYVEAISLFEEMRSALVIGRDLKPKGHKSQKGSRGTLRTVRGNDTAVEKRARHEPPVADSHCASAVLEVCASAGAWREAIAIVETLPSRGIAIGSRHVRPALASCTRAGKAELGLAFLRRMRSPSDGISRHLPTFRLDKPALATALTACAKVGDAEMAQLLLQELEALGEPLDARMRCSAISAYGRADRWHDAVELLRVDRTCVAFPGTNVEKAGKDIVLVDTACYNAALGALQRAGQWSLCRRLVAQMQAGDAPPPDDITRRTIRKCPQELQLGGTK